MTHTRNSAITMENIATSMISAVRADGFPNNATPAMTINNVHCEDLILGLTSYEKKQKDSFGIKRHWVQIEGKAPQTSIRSSSYTQVSSITALIGAAVDDNSIEGFDFNNISITILTAYGHPLIVIWLDGLSCLAAELMSVSELEVYQASYLPSQPVTISGAKKSEYLGYLRNDLIFSPDVSDEKSMADFIGAVRELHDLATGKRDVDLNELEASFMHVTNPVVTVKARTIHPELCFEGRDLVSLKTEVELTIGVFNDKVRRPANIIRMEFFCKVLEGGDKKPWFKLTDRARRQRVSAVNNGAGDFEGDKLTVDTKTKPAMTSSKVTFETNSYTLAVKCLKEVTDSHALTRIDEIQMQAAAAIAESLAMDNAFSELRLGWGGFGNECACIEVSGAKGQRYIFSFN